MKEFLETRSQNPSNSIPESPFCTRGSSTRSSSSDGSFSNDRFYHPSPRSSSSLLDELRSERVQKNKVSPSKPLQEQKDLYKSPNLADDLIASTSFQSSSKKADEQDQKSKFGVERKSVKNLYQSPLFKASLSEYAASSSKEDISRLKNLRKDYEKASKSLKKEAEDDLFDLVSSKTSISRRTLVVGSPLPTRVPSISAGSTTDKRKISPTSYETVTQGSSIKPRTKHEELIRLWVYLFGLEISTPELIRKHLSAELKKDKKINIDEDIRNTQAGKSAGVAGWLKLPLFGYAIANHLRRPLYYFSPDSMHTYLPTSSSYSGFPPFCMAFVDTNHYVALHFKNVNGSIPAPPIDGWWLRKSSSRNKNLWLQSLGNDLKLFQKIMPSFSGGAVIILD
ncbi:hypothetical protein PPACK8108_LOCUS17327 [Phakopsora pachyrhizi]|uniref:Uncharacterized protein n=1 Tax=Phakopsora pachyrhizi TaxID=170000 RepID=A0AAV0BCS9_PHAPC|nr:hypothetical protein PPACK8108_LOCUS17327 [Phakopsora pachyrhizi]